ncbi:MAG: hypothetical protein C4348_02770, partial [Patescibacteria group bacterium]
TRQEVCDALRELNRSLLPNQKIKITSAIRPYNSRIGARQNSCHVLENGGNCIDVVPHENIDFQELLNRATQAGFRVLNESGGGLDCPTSRKLENCPELICNGTGAHLHLILDIQ